MDVNLTGALLCTRAIGPHMLARRSGKIINIASWTAHSGGEDMVLYTVAKTALTGFTRAQALEWAPYGVQVNAISPGLFPDIVTGGEEGVRRSTQRAEQTVPLRRTGRLKEVGYLAAVSCFGGVGLHDRADHPARRRPEPRMSGPLAGIRVLDLTTVQMGPWCTRIVADFGADVIKVEAPEGDSSRYTGVPRHRGMSGSFQHNARGKRSIAIDLKQPAARDAILRLVPTVDAFASNIRSAALARLGLDYESVRQAQSVDRLSQHGRLRQRRPLCRASGL